jgi:hypothetical protein
MTFRSFRYFVKKFCLNARAGAAEPGSVELRTPKTSFAKAGSEDIWRSRTKVEKPEPELVGTSRD